MKLPKGVKFPVFSYKGNEDIKVLVGYIEDEIYYSKRRPKHKFNIFQGFAMSIDVYNQLVDYNVYLIRLYYKGQIYESAFSQWNNSFLQWENQILKTKKKDPQIILEIQYMKVNPITQNNDYELK